MSNNIEIIVIVEKKSTIQFKVFPDEIKSLNPKFKIKYDISNILTDWLVDGSSITLDAGNYTLIFDENIKEYGWIPPNIYELILDSDDNRIIKIVYYKNKTGSLKIEFNIPPEYQKYLDWKLVKPQFDNDIILFSGKNQTKYENNNLLQGNYQLIINESKIDENITNIYDYETGELLVDYNTYIKNQVIDIVLEDEQYLYYNYSDLNRDANDNSGLVHIDIIPNEISNYAEWKLVPTKNDNVVFSNYWFKNNTTVKAPFNEYQIYLRSISGWFVKNDVIIKIDNNEDIVLSTIKYEQHGNLRIKINGHKDDGKWRIVIPDIESINEEEYIWYSDNEEITVFPDSYLIKFQDILNYKKPDDVMINVESNKITTKTFEYLPYGLLTINITNSDIVTSLGTPQYRIIGKFDWKDISLPTYLDEGTYNIEFNIVGNVFSCENKTVNIEYGQNTILDVEYIGLSLIALSHKNGINIYNCLNFQRIYKLTDISNDTTINQITINNNLLAIVRNNKPSVLLYDIINYENIDDLNFVPLNSGARSVSFSNDNNYLAVSYNSSPYLEVYDKINWSKIDLSIVPTNYCNKIKFSPLNTYLVVGFDVYPYILVYDIQNSFEVVDITSINSEVFSLNFNPTENLLVVGCEDKIGVYDIFNGLELTFYNGFNDIKGTIYGTIFVNNYLVIISSLYLYTYHFEKENNDYVQKNKIEIVTPNLSSDIFLSPDNKYLFISCIDNPFILVYDTTSWELVDFDNSDIYYSKSLVISDSLTNREYIERPTNIFPTIDSKSLSSGQLLQASEFNPISYLNNNITDIHEFSEWRVISSNNEIVHSSTSSDNLISYEIPNSFFETIGSYEWQVRYKGQQLGWSLWSERSSFTTSMSNIVQPTNLTPTNGSIDVEEQPTLTSDAFSVNNDTDNHKYSQWKVWKKETDDIYTLIYNSGAVTASTSHQIPKGFLLGGDGTTVYEYKWSVRYRGENIDWSDWSTETTFTTGTWYIVKPVNIQPINGQIDINEDLLTLVSSEFESIGYEINHVNSQYEIYNATTNELIFNSGEIVDTRIETDLEFVVPGELLIDGEIEYKWRIRYKGHDLRWSEWSDFTTFITRELQTASVNVQIDIDGVLSNTHRWRWRKSNELTFSDYIVSDTITNIPSPQTIIIEAESISGYIVPSPLTVQIETGSEYVYVMTYQQLFGSITCSITGIEGGQWKLTSDSVWNDSGFTLTRIPYGLYSIEFSDVSGYIKPFNVNGIVINSNTVKSFTGNYIEDTDNYWLMVNIGGTSDGRWKLINDTEWYDSSFKKSLINISSDTIVFKDIDNFQTPQQINIQVPDDYENNPHPTQQNTIYYESYYEEDEEVYQLIVNIENEEVGGRWKLASEDPNIWHNSSYIANLSGLLKDTIIFREVSGYIKPVDFEINVLSDYISNVELRHESIPNTYYINRKYVLDIPIESSSYIVDTQSVGYITFNSNLSNENLWYIDGNNTVLYNSGEKVELTSGTYTINFTNVDDYAPIEAYQITIVNNCDFVYNIVYERNNISLLKINLKYAYHDSDELFTMEDAIIGGGWSTNNIDFYTSNKVIEVPLNTSFTVYFKDIENFITPEIITIQTIDSFSTYDVVYRTDSFNNFIKFNGISSGKWKLEDSETIYDFNKYYRFDNLSEIANIEFIDINGYITPGNFQLSINSFIINRDIEYVKIDEIKTTLPDEYRSYPIEDCGFLTVEMNPSQGSFNISGIEMAFSVFDRQPFYPGQYFLSFNKIDNYIEPEDKSITILEGEHLYQTYNYKRCGYLTINTNISIGRPINFYVDNDSNIRYCTNEDFSNTYKIEEGIYSISFENLTHLGYNIIDPIQIVISHKEIKTITINYIKEDNQSVSKINSININVLPESIKNESTLEYRIKYSDDNISWSNWSVWINYYNSDGTYNNKIINPSIGYYKIEFSNVSGYIITESIKTIEMSTSSIKEVTFNYNSDNIELETLSNYKIDLNITVLDSAGKILNNIPTELINQLYFKYVSTTSDTVINNLINDKNYYLWNDSPWIKYENFNEYFGNVPSNDTYVFQVKPIENYFNFNTTGLISIVNFNSENTAVFELKFMNYTFSNITFEILFDSNDFFISNMSNFQIVIKTKNDYYDFYGNEQIVTMYGNITYRNINGISYPCIHSRSYTFQELFNNTCLGYIKCNELENIAFNGYEKLNYTMSSTGLILMNGFHQVVKLNKI